ncbi:MAG: hypothetical protein ACXADA_08515 [Candidatus Hodarchaeales archaeon]|jgi:hypothetical protein
MEKETATITIELPYIIQPAGYFLFNYRNDVYEITVDEITADEITVESSSVHNE